ALSSSRFSSALYRSSLDAKSRSSLTRESSSTTGRSNASTWAIGGGRLSGSVAIVERERGISSRGLDEPVESMKSSHFGLVRRLTEHSAGAHGPRGTLPRQTLRSA